MIWHSCHHLFKYCRYGHILKTQTALLIHKRKSKFDFFSLFQSYLSTKVMFYSPHLLPDSSSSLLWSLLFHLLSLMEVLVSKLFLFFLSPVQLLLLHLHLLKIFMCWFHLYLRISVFYLKVYSNKNSGQIHMQHHQFLLFGD